MSIRLQRAARIFLALVVSLSTPVPLFAESRAVAPDFELRALRALAPTVDQFARAGIDANLSGIWGLDEVDLDPWFLRTQEYVAPLASAAAEDPSYVVGRDHLVLQVPGAPKALKIARPLAPLFAFDRFLFLKPTDAALFKGRLPAGDASEGLFFVDQKFVYDEFRRGGERRPVPVFFLPLAGQWTGRVTHVHDRSTGVLALNNGAGHSATLDLETLAHVAKLQALNLRITTFMTLRHDERAYDELGRTVANLRGGGEVDLEFPFALPPRGSTFGFGLFVTGVDLDRPERGLARPRSTFALDLAWLPKAYAEPTTDAFSSLLKVMMVVSATWAASTLAQITVLRPRLLERRADLESLHPPKPPESRTFKVWREAKENLDIMAHAMAVLGNGAQTTGTYLLEYLADRTGTHAAQSGWARRGFEGTLGYIVKFYEWMATSAWVAFFAIFVDGSVEVAGHTLALFYASPVILPWLAGLISEKHRERTAAEFAGTDPTGQNLLWSEAKYNAAMTAVQAPYMKSVEQRRSLMEIVKPDIAKRFRRERINPVDPKNLDAIDDAVDERVEQMMVERNYPPRRAFLFSSPSLVRAFAAKLGYRVDKHADHAFVFQQARWGVIPSVLRDAHAALDDLAREFPRDERRARAVKIVEEMSRRHHVLTRVARRPSEAGRAFHEGYDVRGLFTLLSVKTETADRRVPFLDDWRPPPRGPFERLIVLRDAIATETRGRKFRGRRRARLLRERAAAESPDLVRALSEVTWRRQRLEDKLREIDEEAATGLMGAALRDPEAAHLAGRAFQQALAVRLSGNRSHLVASTADIARFGAEARREAIERFERETPALGFDEAEVALETLEIVKRKALEREHEEAVKTWSPERGDWLARRQIAAAHETAARAIGYDLESDDPEIKRAYLEAYRVALSKKVGLRTFEDPADGAEFEVMRLARGAAEDDLARNLEKNDEWESWFARVGPVEKLKFVAHHYADQFLSAYTEATVSNSAFVHATSPAQPGFFQRVRQTEFARRDNWLGRATTYALRVGDAFFDATANKPGLAAWINRRVPLAQDLIADTNVRFRGLPTYLMFSWSLNWYLWGVHFNLPTALFFWFTAGLTSAVHWWSDRVLVNVGVPPLQGFWSQFAHSMLMVTFGYFTSVPFFLFAEDFEKGFDGVLGNCQRWLTNALSR